MMVHGMLYKTRKFLVKRREKSNRNNIINKYKNKNNNSNRNLVVLLIMSKPKGSQFLTYPTYLPIWM
jgi:hypothetical protein